MARNVKNYLYPNSADGYRAELIRLGWKSLRSWAIRHEYKPNTVHTTLERWAQRKDRPPHGGTAKQIMKDLQKTLAEQRRPQ